jgi:uncharacterized protein
MGDRSYNCGSSDLCTRCGLCCTGVLFDWVPVTKDEEPTLRRIGLPMESHDQELRFPQPCSKFEEGLCRIYADRPLSCRHFRCELLKRVDGGDLSVTEADQIVAEAKGMIERLRAAIERELGALLVGKSWTSIFKRWESASPVERAEPSRARLVLDLTVLNRFLDRHFRGEGWRRIMDQ